ncbi:MAG: S8 family serine peptidase [Helicobacter sp.]|nr:S8 family serine peptidase [Helicobacter sp.]
MKKAFKLISTATLPLIFIACGGGGGGGGPSTPSMPTITPNPTPTPNNPLLPTPIPTPNPGTGSGGGVTPGPSGGGSGSGSGGGSSGGGSGGSVTTYTGGYPLDPLRTPVTQSPILTRPTATQAPITTKSIRALGVTSNLLGINDPQYRFKGVKENITAIPHTKSDAVLITHTRKIGVIDSDFATSSGVIGNDANRIVANQGCGYWYCTTSAQGTKSAHGTLVAGTIMQNNSTATIYGYTAGSSNSSTLSYSAEHYGAAYQAGVRIFNGSFGSNIDESIIKSQGWKNQVDSALPYHMQFINQYRGGIIHEMAAKDSIFVWAAGNDGANSSKDEYASPLSHIPVIYEEAKRGWLAVAAVNYSGTALQYYSNKIGPDAKNWGIAAPDSHYVYGQSTSGTSFAAPVVTAAVANVWEKFPWMSNHLVTQTILSTANQLGNSNVTTGPNDQVGWGVLNEKRALNGPARFDKRLLVSSDNGFVHAAFDYYADNVTNKSKYTWSNNIAGDAGLKKDGTGILYLSGANTYTGETIVQGGTLVIGNSLSNSKVTITNRGNLVAQNDNKRVTIGSGSGNVIINNGSLSVYGQGLDINGDYKGNETSRIVIDIDKSHLSVSGTLDMGGGWIMADVLKVDSITNTNQAKARDIINANSITNYYGDYSISDRIAPYININSLTHDSKKVSVNYTRNSTAYVLSKMGVTSVASLNAGENFERLLNNLSVDSADSKDSNNSSDSTFTPHKETYAAALSIINGSEDEIRRSIDSLTGEIYISSNAILAKNLRTNSLQLSDRIKRSLNNGSNEVYAEFGAMGYDVGQSGFANADIRGGSGFLGGDFAFNNGIAGVAYYRAESRADFDRFAGEADSESNGVYVYVGDDFDSFYTLIKGGFAKVDNEVKREIITPLRSDRITTSVDSSVINLYAEVGKNFMFNNVRFDPFVAINYDHIS